MRPALRSPDVSDADQFVYLRLDWKGFEQFVAARGDGAGPRITYLDGVLELMAPSKTHEGIKKQLAMLFEAWAQEMGVEVQGYGSWLLKRRQKRSGVEPDECYVIGNPTNPRGPDLAIEVIWTHDRLDKLEVYRRLAVREVWVWKDGELRVHVLRAGKYSPARRSRLFPQLDLSQLVSFALRPNQFQAVAAYRALFRRH